MRIFNFFLINFLNVYFLLELDYYIFHETFKSKMKKIGVFISTVLTLMPFSQSLILKTGLALSTTGLIISARSNVNAAEKKLNPNSLQFILELGFDKIESEDFEGAIKEFTKALENDPNSGNAYFGRGIAKYSLEDYEGAIEDFSESIAINQNDADSYFMRGFAKYDLEDFEGAIADFSKVIAINPDDDDAYYERGMSRYALEDFEGAIDDFTQVIELKPDNEYAYYERGLANYRYGNYERAIDDFTKTFKIDNSFSDNPDIYYFIGASKLNIEDYTGCSDINRALELGNNSDNDWYNSVEVNFCTN